MAITPEQLFTTLPSVLKAAPVQYLNSLNQDPALYKAYYGELPSYQQWAVGKDGWGMDEFGAYNPDLLNSDNLDVVGYDANGNFQVKLKTGDKEGSIYTYAKQPDGTFKLQPTGSSQYWDTNQGILEDPIALAMLLGVGGIAAGGIGAASGLWADPLAAGASGVGGSGLAAGDIGGGLFVGEEAASPALQGLLGGEFAATPQITDAMLTGANATSDPIAYLNAQAGWTAADPAYLSTLTTVPVGTTIPGYQDVPITPSTPSPSSPVTPAPQNPAANKDVSSLLGSLPDSLKWLAPLVLGGLTAYETKNANGQVNAYGPSMDKYNSLLGKTWGQPQFTTGLLPPPAPKKYY